MTAKRPTVAAATESHPLAPAVLRQLGGGADAVQSALDAAEHGADGGFPGFTYYSDTCEFVKRNRKAIADAVEQMADDLGEDLIAMVRGFRCLEDDTPSKAIALALFAGGDGDDVMLVENALAWFALEEVGRAIEALND